VDRGSPEKASGVDALITNDPEVVLGIYVADCCAIYFVDPLKGVIGIAHSGRKGTEQNIAGVMVERMVAGFGSAPEDLVVQLSPCIRPPFYEVDFAAQIVIQLQAGGVRQIYDSGENTGADFGRFYSYRMEKGSTGRMLAFLALTKGDRGLGPSAQHPEIWSGPFGVDGSAGSIDSGFSPSANKSTEAESALWQLSDYPPFP
jgi:copper oxidase (laccase) domain-containing protein